MRNNRVLLIAFSFIWLHLSAQTSLESIKSEWKTWQQEESVKKANLSISLMRCDTKEFLLKENTKALSPASNLKLVTTATALQLLGADYRYETVLAYEGKLSRDTLFGNIIIRSSGDPSLGSERLNAPYLSPDSIMIRWVQAIRKEGIRVVKGKVLVDLSCMEYNPIPDNWAWGDMGNYYGAGIFGLNMHDNLFRVYFTGGTKEGNPTKIESLTPDPGFRMIRNEVLSGPVGSGDEAYLYSAPYSDKLYMKGTIPLGSKSFAVRGSIPDPATMTASMLIRKMLNSNMKIQDTIPQLNYESSVGIKNLDTYQSPPLSELSKLTNVYSLNLYAECMVRTLGKKFGKAGSTAEGVRVIEEYWQNKGMDVKGWHLYDGSGLSFNNAISTSQMCWILATMKGENSFDSFYNSIPVAGVSGTVYRLGKGSALAGNGRLKSGSLSKVTCYSGYVTSADGVLLSVALFTNQYEGSSSTVISKLESVLKKVANLNVK